MVVSLPHVEQDEDEAGAEVEDDDPLSWRLQGGPRAYPRQDPDLLSDSVPSEYSEDDHTAAFANGHRGTIGGRQRPLTAFDSAPAVLLEALGGATGSNGNGRVELPAYLRDVGPSHYTYPMEEEEAAEDAPPGILEEAEGDHEDGFGAVERHLQLLGQLGLSPGSSGGPGGISADWQQHGADGPGADAAQRRLERSNRSFDGGRIAVPRLQLPSIPDEVPDSRP